MDKEVLKELEAPFKLKAREGVGGKTFKYIPSEDVVDRMNKVFLGNWSTEVKDSKIIEDQILMCVTVRVTDNTNGTTYSQDGYSSHPVARYSSGLNKGKILDIGNAYRSAMSKAIKTACTRWGVGLYLEEGEGTSVVDPVIPITSDPAPPIGIRQSVVEAAAGPPIGVPVVDIPPAAKKAPVAPTAPIDTSSNPIEAVPFNTEDNSIVGPADEDMEKLTSVQKVAIETVMSTKNIKFKALIDQALKGKPNIPVKIDDVSYLDAVAIIQYGNHLTPIMEA